MKKVTVFLLILTLYSCTTEICDNKKNKVENILKLQLPRQCNCVSLYKTNIVNDELIGPYRYYIMIKDCENFTDTLITKLSLIKYTDDALDKNSTCFVWDSIRRINACVLNKYSYQALWKLNTAYNSNDTIPKWWTADTSLVKNFANYYIIGDSAIIKNSRLDSLWNGKIVLQKKENRIFVFIETEYPITGMKKNIEQATNR